MKKQLLITIITISIAFTWIFAQDLWNENSGEIFTDRKVLPNGSIIKIVFDNDLVASYKSSLSAMNNRNNESPKVTSSYFDFLPQMSISDNNSVDGKTKVQREQTIKGSISGTINAFNKNSGNYTISASHTVVINGKDEGIQLGAIVAIGKIAGNRQVQSSDLANVRLVFTGVIVKGKQQNINENDFNSLDFLTSASNVSSLTPTIKKKLFINYFNMILKELF